MKIGLKYARWWRSYKDETRRWNEENGNRGAPIVWKSEDESLIVYEHGTIMVYGRIKVKVP